MVSRSLPSKTLELKTTSKLSPSSTIDSCHLASHHKTKTQKLSLNKGWFKTLTEVKGLFHCFCTSQQHKALCGGLYQPWVHSEKQVGRTVTTWNAQHNRFSLPAFLHLEIQGGAFQHLGHLVTVLLLATHLSASCYYGYRDPNSTLSPHIALSLKLN